MRAKVAEVSADFEAAQRLATAKQEECNAQSAEVDRLRVEREGLKSQLATEEKAMETLLSSKAELIADQEFFQKMLLDIKEPLQEQTVAELVSKLKRADIEAALLDALPPALAVSADQRSDFTQKTIDIAVKRFEEHLVSLADGLAEMPKVEELRKAAVAEARSKLEEIQQRFTLQDKAYDELQNAWAELETNNKKQQSNATNFDSEIQATLDEVEARKAALDSTRSIIASFEEIRKEIPVWTPVLPAVENVASGSLEVPAEAVAVAA